MKNITIRVMTGLLCLVFNLESPAQNTSLTISISLDEDYQTSAKLLRPEQTVSAQDLVILFHGSGPYDMDATVPDGIGGVLSANFKLISEYLAENGISSLRYNKRGVLGNGNYDQVQLQKAMSLPQLVSDAEEMLNYALALPDVNNIYLFGWSEGAWVASHLAAKRFDDVAGIILQAPPNSSLVSIVRSQHIDNGLPYLSEIIDVDENGALSVTEILSIPPGPVQLMPRFYMWDPSSSLQSPVVNKYVDTDSNGEINLETELRPAIERTLSMMATRPPAMSPVIADVMKNVPVPIAILHGDMDGWVPSDESEEIKLALQEKVTLFRYKDLGHSLSQTSVLSEDGFNSMEAAPLSDLVAWITHQ